MVKYIDEYFREAGVFIPEFGKVFLLQKSDIIYFGNLLDQSQEVGKKSDGLLDDTNKCATYLARVFIAVNSLSWITALSEEGMVLWKLMMSGFLGIVVHTLGPLLVLLYMWRELFDSPSVYRRWKNIEADRKLLLNIVNNARKNLMVVEATEAPEGMIEAMDRLDKTCYKIVTPGCGFYFRWYWFYIAMVLFSGLVSCYCMTKL